jgi:polyisoprenoid-binding protein YceI
VPIPTSTYRLGPADGILSLRTGRTGKAAKAGHDLVIHVTSWKATFEVAGDPAATSIQLDGDGGSLRVHEGHGGLKSLTENDKADIAKTIDDEILKKQGVSFRSTRVVPAADGTTYGVQGDLTLVGTTRPIAFDLVVGDGGALTASVVVDQTQWGIKPYSTLFGALKVANDVEIRLEARLPA